jgi:3-deoxy-D-manno-octulosonate 8-phosphate phosphatase (KDO 8-P phosphatase)
MKIAFVAKGCSDKASALRDFATATGVALASICYIGDDVNDVAAMEIAGLSAAPANAVVIAQSHATFVTRHSGGNGAVREIIDAILAAQELDTREVFSRP